MDKIALLADFFRKVPASFLVAIATALALILFLPEELATLLAVSDFRNEHRVYLGPAFLFVLSFCVARLYMFVRHAYSKRKRLQKLQKRLHHLTPEEKGYLVPYIEEERNSLYVGIDDGIMSGLSAKGITYRATNIGDWADGIAFNLQPWARQYLEINPYLLDGYTGQPLTPRERRTSRW